MQLYQISIGVTQKHLRLMRVTRQYIHHPIRNTHPVKLVAGLSDIFYRERNMGSRGVLALALRKDTLPRQGNEVNLPDVGDIQPDSWCLRYGRPPAVDHEPEHTFVKRGGSVQ